jgi:hypothetical protein
MTRINVGVKPSELCSKHLIAEHREIKRVPNVVKSGKAILKNIPTKFTLGTGHVKFFYNKLGYLRNRYIELHKECLSRGFKVSNFIDVWDGIDPRLMNDYVELEYDRHIMLNRINERLNKR